MAVPSSLEPAATLEKKDLRQKLIVDDQVPPAPTSAAASHEAAVAATELASTSKDGLVDLSLSRCFLMDKEKEGTWRYLGNMAFLQIKKSPEQGESEVTDTDSKLKRKEISGAKSSCVSSTRTAEDADKDGQPVPCMNDAKSLTQLLVKVCRNTVSVQEDLNVITVKQFVKAACQKIGVHAYDFYAVYGGKPLKDDKLMSCYPIYRGSTVCLRQRLRAGSPQVILFKSYTFDEMIENRAGLFHVVHLSQHSTNSMTQVGTVTYLSDYSQYIIHEVLIYICGKHRKGWSFSGNFESTDILFCSGRVKIAKRVHRVNFNKDTCGMDYMKLYEIFVEAFAVGMKDNQQVFPMFLPHLLEYLFACPAGENSNHELAITFLTNHPALASYMDRIKQCILLDSMVDSLDPVDLLSLKQLLNWVWKWSQGPVKVPGMNSVYIHNAKFHPVTHQMLVNARYIPNPLGCLHFSGNYFSHAHNHQLNLEEAEAAFAENTKSFLPFILQFIVVEGIIKQKFNAPAHFHILTLLGNKLADKNTGKKLPGQDTGS